MVRLHPVAPLPKVINQPVGAMSRHWTINGRFLGQRVTGVQRHGLEVMHCLDELVSEGHPLAHGLTLEVLAPPSVGRPPPLRAIGVRTAGRLDGHLWEQVELPLHARGGILSLCNTSTVMRRKQIVCMHDINFLAFPQSYSARFRMVYRALLPVIGRTAACVATVSHFSADQLVEHGIVRRDKLIVVPNGHEHALRWQKRHSPATASAAGPGTIVIIGSPAPHKNVGMILGLASRLAAAGLRIAVVGRVDTKVFSGATRAAEASNIDWLGGVSDEAMAALLTTSLCLVFPSFVEGFGLPPLEAMALGCPVVSSDRASMPEICGDAALYAAPDAPEDWYAALVELQRDAQLRMSLVAKGHVNVARYSWRRAAELYLEAMARVDQFKGTAAQPAGAAT
jgi:glycosyltransferase involved in cell wall biosynthesis